MPDFNEIKNKATDALNTAKEGAEGFVAGHQGEIDAAKAKAEEAATKVGAAVSDMAGKAVDKAEELSGQDLDGDGVIGRNPEEAGADAPKEGFFSKAVNKVEGVTGIDFDGDGTVAGAAEAPVAEAVEEAAETAASEAPEIPGETFTA